MRMFRNLMNSNIGYYLYSAIILLFGAGALIFFYFMVTGFNIGVYSENTIIGNVYVGGLTEEEAEEKVRNHLINWLEDDDVVFEVGYQGYYYEFDRELFTFNIPASMLLARDGARNNLVVNYSTGARNTVDFQLLNEPFMDGLQDQFDMDEMIEDVLRDASELRRFSRMELNHYIIDEAQLFETIHEVTLPVPQGVSRTTLLNKLNAHLPEGNYPIDSYSINSVLDDFDATFTSSELNVIGMLLQGLIKHSTMYIQESHFNPQIDFNLYTLESYPYYGVNVRINRSLNFDFVFENHHMIDYHVEFFEIGQHIGARLIGPPYLYTIETETVMNRIDHPTQTTTNEGEAQEGVDAMHVVVTRRIIDIFDNPVIYENDETVEIIFEFYPSITEIIYEGPDDENDE